MMDYRRRARAALRRAGKDGHPLDSIVYEVAAEIKAACAAAERRGWERAMRNVPWDYMLPYPCPAPDESEEEQP